MLRLTPNPAERDFCYPLRIEISVGQVYDCLFAEALLNGFDADRIRAHFRGGTEKGEPPSRFAEIQGCPFVSRCPATTGRCSAERPAVRDMGAGRSVACHNA